MCQICIAYMCRMCAVYVPYMYLVCALCRCFVSALYVSHTGGGR
jgi:hypothetical protein